MVHMGSGLFFAGAGRRAVLVGAVVALLSACGGGDAPPVTGIAVEGAVAYGKSLTLVISGNGLDTSNVSFTTQGCQGLKVLAGGTPERKQVSCTVTGTAQVKATAKTPEGTVLLEQTFAVPQPKVELQTTLGNLVLELYPDKAPATVFNFLAQVNSGFYANTLFHRVVPGFVVQGGGYDASLVAKKPSTAAIALETPNGLLNVRGTVGMARGSVPQSATTQFYVNLKDNPNLDYTDAANPGYAVFGSITQGLTVLDSMAQVATGTVGGLGNVPLAPVVLSQAVQLQ
jgi:cyclophilin family peptidyl-prolyl cis-trans isomerase